MLVGKPGLDGHSNGAEQIAVRARDTGFEVVDGIRSTLRTTCNCSGWEGAYNRVINFIWFSYHSRINYGITKK